MRSVASQVAAVASLLLLVLALPGYSQTWQALPNAPSRPRIDDVFFLDERMGWTFCDGSAYRTLDGGSTWQAFAASGVSMRSITFVSPNRGFIGSLNRTTPLWATADSGKTWTSVTLPEPRPQGICGLSAVDSQVVYGCGRYDGFPTVIKTSDGGATWTSIDLSAYAQRLIDCRFTDVDSGLVVGGVRDDDGRLVSRILSTHDGGQTWTVRHTGRLVNSWAWKISFPTPKVGYVSIEAPDAGMYCLKSEDGGLSWVEMPVRPSAGRVMQGIGFSTSGRGWACDHQAFRTDDGGATWVADPIGGNINRIRFLSPTLGFASGTTIYKYSLPTPVQQTTIGAIKARYRSP